MRFSWGLSTLAAGLATVQAQYLINELSFGFNNRYAILLATSATINTSLTVRAQDIPRREPLSPQFLSPGSPHAP